MQLLFTILVYCKYIYTCISHIARIYLPVLCEDTDSRRVVGTVSYIKALHLWYEGQEEAPDPLLALWKSLHTQTDRLVINQYNIS